MSENIYLDARKKLTDSGLKVLIAKYHSATFGSFYIELKASPDCRLVWDGKDAWFVVQEKTNELFNGIPVWNDIWVGEKNTESDFAISKVLEHCNAKPRKKPWWKLW